MDSGAVDEIDNGNNSSSSSSKVRKGYYTPLSFYMDSAVNHPSTILKCKNSSENKNKNYIPLSFFKTTVIYQPVPGPIGESKMDIFVSDDETSRLLTKYFPLSIYFYIDPTISIPGLSLNYYSHPPNVVSNSSQSKSAAAAAKVIFSCFGSSESRPMAPAMNIRFGSFGCKFSETKVSRNYIPEEVALSILSKLSVKSLKRFGCVCKSWSILFENTDFMTMYSKHFISRHSSDDDYQTFILKNYCVGYQLYHSEFYLPMNGLIYSLPYPLQQSRTGTCILGCTSVNDIFCIGRKLPCSKQESRYALWNPLTEEFMEVPPSPAELTPSLLHDHEDMSLEHNFHGFGYDKLRDDFKVIQYVSFCDSFCSSDILPTSFFEIYSLKSNSWRMIHMDKDLDHMHHNFKSSEFFDGLEVYLDGACHWLVLGSIKDLDAITGLSLFSFDLSDEVFVTTPIGEEPYSPPFPRHCLTVLNESIVLISSYHIDDIVFHISIWGELGVDESWIKLYIYGPLPSVQWPPIGFGKMRYMFITKNNHKVAYVDLSTQIIEEVGIFSKRNSVRAGLYKKSLRRIK